MFEITTDRNGVAVIIVRQWLYEVDRDGDVLKVRDKDYRYNSWEDEFDLVWKYSENHMTRQFLVSSIYNELDVWNKRETMPTNFEIYKKITNEDYISHRKGTACYYDERNNGYDPPYGTPGLFEITIRLNYQSHSKDVQIYSNSNNGNSNNSSSNNSASNSSGIYVNQFQTIFPNLPSGYSISQNDESGTSFENDKYQIFISKGLSRESFTVKVMSRRTGRYVSETSWISSLSEAKDILYDYMRSN